MGDNDSDSDSDWDFEARCDLEKYIKEGGLKKDFMYVAKNHDRKPSAESQAWYAKQCDWSGKGEGESAKVGIATIGAKHGLYENSANVGILKVGAYEYDGDGWEVGTEVEVSAVSANHRYGPAEVQGKLLTAKVTGTFGRNTGAIIVKADLASVTGRVGPASLRVGVAVDTGASIGLDGVEVLLLGTGAVINRNVVGVSLFGSNLTIPAPWRWFD